VISVQIKIVANNEKPLLSKKELEAEIAFSTGTPSRTELKKQLATGLKLDQELIVIRKIQQIFGDRKAKLFANIYNTKEDMQKHESKVLLQKGQPKEKKEGEAPKEAPKKEEKPKKEEAKPKEEAPKKEAPKPEPKKE